MRLHSVLVCHMFDVTTAAIECFHSESVERSEKDKNFAFIEYLSNIYRIMSNSIQGSIHQGCEAFIDASRGRQCALMSSKTRPYHRKVSIFTYKPE